MKTAIGLSFFYVTVFALCILTEQARIALLLGSLSPIIIIYLVYKILKDPEEPKDTFESKFYQDHSYQRN